MKASKINRQFIEAVFFLDAKRFKQLLDEFSFDKKLLEDVGHEDCPFPIYWITQCWEVELAHPEEWREECRDAVQSSKERNLEIKRIFEHRFGVKFPPIDYYNTPISFYRSNDDESDDDILDTSKETLLSKGHREMDIDLYIAVHRFDFERVKQLLKAGANPYHNISEDEDEEYDCMKRIGHELSFLSTQLSNVALGKERFSITKENGDSLLRDLFGLAAHGEMYALIEKYAGERPPID